MIGSQTVAKNFTRADRSWTFLDGSKRAVVILNSVVIGQGEYLPGWRWSQHVGAQTGRPSQAHIGLIVSGRMGVRDSEGRELTLDPGDAFEMGPESDAWVIGDETCIALDFESLA
jgi:hypothetical protein